MKSQKPTKGLWDSDGAAMNADHYHQLRSLAVRAAEEAEDGSPLQRETGVEAVILSLHVVEPWSKTDRQWKRFGPMFGFADGSGQPDPSTFKPEVFQLCRQRASTTTNPIVRALYLDLVWEIERDHTAAREAVAAYDDLFKDQRTRGHPALAADAICRAAQIAWSLNDAELAGPVSRSLSGLLSGEGHEVTQSDQFIWELATFVDQNARRFDTDILYEAARNLSGHVDSADLSDPNSDFDSLHDVANIGTRWFRKVGDHEAAHTLRLEAGDILVAKAQIRGSESALVRAAGLQQAISYFNSIGEHERATALGGEAQEAGEVAEQQMGTVSTEATINLAPWLNGVRKLKHDRGSTIALREICLDPSTIPFWNDAVRLVDQQQEQRSILSHISHVTYAHGRQVNESRTSEEIREHLAFRVYSMSESLKHVVFSAMWEELTAGNDLSLEDLKGFVSQGAPFQSEEMELISLSLDRFWADDYVSFMHIVAPRIETALVWVAIRNGCQGTKTSAGRTRRIDLDDALGSEQLTDFLGPDETRWMSFVLSDERHGLNLRNQIAHGLLIGIDLSKDNALRLLHVLLRLACVREQHAEGSS